MPPASPTFLENIRPTGTSTPCGTPTNPTVAPGSGDGERRLHRRVGADALEHRIGAHSPGDLGDLGLARPCRASATMWVAPNSVATFWRDSWRDIATIFSAPITDAASTPHRPTAPSPTTTAVPPSGTPAATAACQPVAITSVSASSERVIASSGSESVRTRLPSAWVTRAYSACPLTVMPRFVHTDCMPARQCTQVLSQWQNGTITKSPGLEGRDLGPDLDDLADALVADRRAGADRVLPAIGPQVGAADAAGVDLHDRVGGELHVGSGTSDTRMSPGAWMVVARMPSSSQGRRPPRTGAENTPRHGFALSHM